MNDYIPPTAQETRDLLRRWNLTGRGVADLIGCHPRAVRKWCSASERESMPFASLYCLARRAADIDVTPEQWRQQLFKRPKKTTSFRTCPQCGGRATKIFNITSGVYRCQQCNCRYRFDGGHAMVIEWDATEPVSSVTEGACDDCGAPAGEPCDPQCRPVEAYDP